MTRPVGYAPSQIALHWAIAGLVLFNYLYSEGMGDALDARLEGEPAGDLALNPAIHVWVGVAVLVLVLARLVVRLTRGAPAAGGDGLQQKLAAGGHHLLYLVMLAVPVFGALTWFGRLDAFGDLHALTANGLMILAGGHALLALWHQFVVKDGLLRRMLRP